MPKSPPAGPNATPTLTTQHRGVRSYRWTWGHTGRLLLPLAVHGVLLALLFAPVQHLWQEVLAWAWPHLGLGAAERVQATSKALWGIDWPLVKVYAETPLPELWQWWAAALSALGLLGASWLMPRERLPLIYLLRTLGLLGLVSLLLYEFFTGWVNLRLDLILNDLLTVGATLLWLLPLLHALVLYIFPLSVPQRIGATAVAQLFTVLAVPLQVGAVAWLVTQASSLALLPVYMLITFLPHITAQLGIYGYFMSLARLPR